MARKKKKRGLRNFGSLNISLNIPFNLSGQGNRIGAELFDKNPELKEYLTKESFEKLYDSEFSEFTPPAQTQEVSDPYSDALNFLNSGASSEQIKAFLQTLLGKTTFGDITNFEETDNSIGDNYAYAFSDGTPLFNPSFISSLQGQLETLGLDLDDLQALLDQANADNDGLTEDNQKLVGENNALLDENASLSGQVIALQTQLAQDPIFGSFNESGELVEILPSAQLNGSGQIDSTGIAQHIQVNCPMVNVTSKLVTIYKISPGQNIGVSLTSENIQRNTSNVPIFEKPVSVGSTSFSFGNNGNPRIDWGTFELESESVYVIEIIGRNDAGVVDNPEPKETRASAIFTTVDSDEATISNLQNDIANLTTELETEIISGIGLQNQINTLNGDIATITAERNLAQNSSANARGALDGFSDSIQEQILSLRNALTQEAVTDSTISSMNNLISVFNNSIVQINENTPPSTAVTQIASFEASEIEGQGGGEDASGFFPTNYPEWLGGDNISIQDNDNILFDLGLNLQQTPIFTIPDLVYVDDRFNMPIGIEDPVPADQQLENKFLTILRFTALRATNSVVKNNSGKSGFIIGRGNNFTSNHSQTPHTYLNGNINNVIDDWSMSGEIEGTMRTPQLTVATSNGTFNLGHSGINATLEDRIIQPDRKGIGNKNIVSLASPSFYGSDEAQSLIYLNAGDTFRFNINPESLPYIDDNNINQSYVLGLTFHFVVKNYDSYEIRTRRCTGVFNFNGGALMGV